MKEYNVEKLGEVLLEDWLIKSPPKTKISSIKSWLCRYFVLVKITKMEETIIKNWSKKGPKGLQELKQFYLIYWESQNGRRKGLKPIRTIPITKDHTIHMQSHPYWQKIFHHVLALNTPNRKYFLCAETANIKKKWFEALTHVITSQHQDDIFTPEVSKDVFSNDEELKKNHIYATLEELNSSLDSHLHTSNTSDSNKEKFLKRVTRKVSLPNICHTTVLVHSPTETKNENSNKRRRNSFSKKIYQTVSDSDDVDETYVKMEANTSNKHHNVRRDSGISSNSDTSFSYRNSSFSATSAVNDESEINWFHPRSDTLSSESTSSSGEGMYASIDDIWESIHQEQEIAAKKLCSCTVELAELGNKKEHCSECQHSLYSNNTLSPCKENLIITTEELLNQNNNSHNIHNVSLTGKEMNSPLYDVPKESYHKNSKTVAFHDIKIDIPTDSQISVIESGLVVKSKTGSFTILKNDVKEDIKTDHSETANGTINNKDFNTQF